MLWARQTLRLRLKLVEIAACIALTFFPQTITESSVSDWLTARAVGYDNILLGATQVQSMEPSRKLGTATPTRNEVYGAPVLIYSNVGIAV